MLLVAARASLHAGHRDNDRGTNREESSWHAGPLSVEKPSRVCCRPDRKAMGPWSYSERTSRPGGAGGPTVSSVARRGGLDRLRYVGLWSYGTRPPNMIGWRRDAQVRRASRTLDARLPAPVGAHVSRGAGHALRPVRGSDAPLRLLAPPHHGGPDGHAIHRVRAAGRPCGPRRGGLGMEPRRAMASARLQGPGRSRRRDTGRVPSSWSEARPAGDLRVVGDRHRIATGRRGALPRCAPRTTAPRGDRRALGGLRIADPQPAASGVDDVGPIRRGLRPPPRRPASDRGLSAPEPRSGLVDCPRRRPKKSNRLTDATTVERQDILRREANVRSRFDSTRRGPGAGTEGTAGEPAPTHATPP